MRILPFLTSFLFPVAAYAFTVAGGGIAESKHDLNFISGFPTHSQKEICVFCHTPHHAQTDGFKAPLWSKSLKNTNFVLPQNIQSKEGDPLTGPTRLCLTCHDGITATGMDARASSHGNALGAAHPLGMDYEAIANAKPNSFRPPSTPFFGNPSIKISDVLFEGRYVTCASCHDVHNRRNVSHMPATYNYFVYAPQKDSALCCTCHTQGTPGQ